MPTDALPERKEWKFALALALLALLLFCRHLVGPYTLLNDDLDCQYYPMRLFTRQEFWAGRFPLWNPYIYCGVPMAGDIEDAIFYPFNWLTFIFPLTRFFAWMAAFHFWLASWGTYLCCRQLKFSTSASLLAGAAFGMGGAAAASAFSGTHLYVQSWLPWMILGLQRDRWGLVALSLCAQILGGSPQFLVYNWLTGLFFGCAVLAPEKGWLRTARCFFLGSVVGTLVSAIQLVPFVEMIRFSSRKEVALTQHLSQYSRLEWDWSWLFPERLLLEPDHLHQAYFLTSGVLIVTLLSGLVRKERATLFRACLVFAGVALLAASDFTPVTWLFSHLVPGYSMLRCQVRWLSATFFMGSFLLAMGWEWIRQRIKPGISQVALLVALLLNILSLSYKHQPLTPMTMAGQDPDSYTKFASRAPAGSRPMFCPLLAMRYMNWAEIYSIPSASGYSAMVISDYQNFIGYAAKGRMLTAEETKLLNLMSNIAPWSKLSENFSAVACLGAIASLPAGGSEEVVALQPRFERWRLVHRFEVAPTMAQTYQRLYDSQFNPAQAVLLSEAPSPLGGDSGPSVDHVSLSSFAPDEIELDVETDQAGFLVLSETYYPGWVAEIDNVEVPVVRAYWAFRAVRIEPGKHKVRVKYRPGSVRAGALITLFTLIALGFYALISAKRARLS